MRTTSSLKPPGVVLREQALQFVTRAISETGLKVKQLPPDEGTDLLACEPSGHKVAIKVLATAAPHRRGGTGDLGLHWMFQQTAADFVALVDLSRSQGWLLSTYDFRQRANSLDGGRYHLDWIVVRLGRARKSVPDEEDFAAYGFDKGLRHLLLDSAESR